MEGDNMYIGDNWLSEPEVAALVIQMKEMLQEAAGIMSQALFANYKDYNAYKELEERIKALP